MATLLTVISGIAWIIVYEECIRIGLKNKTYCMPLFRGKEVLEIGYLLKYDFWSREDEFITQYYNGDMLHYLYFVRR